MADVWELRVVWTGLPPTTNAPHAMYLHAVGPTKFGLPGAPENVTLLADNHVVAHWPIENEEPEEEGK